MQSFEWEGAACWELEQVQVGQLFAGVIGPSQRLVPAMVPLSWLWPTWDEGQQQELAQQLWASLWMGRKLKRTILGKAPRPGELRWLPLHSWFVLIFPVT